MSILRTDTYIDHVDDLLWPELFMDDINRISILEDIINITTQDSEVDPAAILFTFLSGFGAMVGSGAHVKIGETQHPSRINSVLVGASSRARKGTSEHPVRRILKAAQEYAKIPEINIAPGPLSSGEGLIYAVRDAGMDGVKPDPGIQDKRLWCIESEFANVFKAGKREGNTLSCIIRTAWDGGTIAPLTKNNKVCATDPHIAILGHITREELKQVLNATETWNGFANRFLWVCVRRHKLVPLPSSIDAAVINAIACELSEILSTARTHKELILTPLATALWSNEYPALTKDIPGRYGVITSRAEAHTMRLALICALLDGRDQIDSHHLKAAMAIWQYSSCSAKLLFGDSDTTADMKKILHALEESPMTTTALHDLFNGHKTSIELNNLLMQLSHDGKIIKDQPNKGNRRGRYATLWSMTRDNIIDRLENFEN